MPELISSNHDKVAGSEMYQVVPSLFERLLQEPSFDSVEGVVFGGSYSSGNFVPGDDVDVDFLFKELPDINQLRILVMITMSLFGGNKIPLHVRASVDRTGKMVAFYEDIMGRPIQQKGSPAGARRMQETLYTRHPNSPFIVRSEEVADYWHLRN